MAASRTDDAALDDTIGTDPCSCVVEAAAEDGEASDVRRAAALGALSTCSHTWRTLAIPALEAVHKRLIADLARRLMPLATGALGAAAVDEKLSSLSPDERRLLKALHASPAPLLALETPEAGVASWVLMRLSLFSSSIFVHM